MKLPKGKRLKPVLLASTQSSYQLGAFVSWQVNISLARSIKVEKGDFSREVLQSLLMLRVGLRTAARRKAGLL